MFAAIIVDDEKMIRMGIKKAIHWDLIGINKVYLAASGQEALDLIVKKRPEIMITDIRMAEISGLDLIPLVRQITPLIRIIVLTGYDSFEYARQCLRMNVQDFLLKPIDEKDLAASLKKQVECLESDLNTEPEDPNVRRVQEVAKQIVLEKNLRDLMHGKMKAEAFFSEEFYKDFPYEKGRKIQVAIIVPPRYVNQVRDDQDYTVLTVKNICMSLVDLERDGITFLDDDGNTVIIYFSRENPSETMENIQKLIGILKDEYNIALKAAIGNPVIGFENVAVSYNDAILHLQANDDVFEEIFQSGSSQKKNNPFQTAFLEMKSAMCHNIGNTDYVLNLFKRFCTTLDSYNISHRDTKSACYEIASSIYYAFINSTDFQTDDRLISYMKILQDSDRKEVCEVTRIFLIKLLDESNQENANEIIFKTKQYIKENISGELSVAHLAAALYLTPNYLSRLFKKVVGEGCNEYIVRKRIEKAKILLEITNLKSNRIADMVGYRDTNYFSLAFKKNTGVSPTKYRERFR